MTVYNFNLGIGWASSGVEYAQVYRAESFRRLGVDAKFIFTDLITQTNVENLTKNIGFKDSEVIWLYQYFTDFPIAPTTYTMADLEQTLTRPIQNREVAGIRVKLSFSEKDWVMAYLKQAGEPIVEQAEYVLNNNLVRKDFFISRRWMSEYYLPVKGQARCYQRRYFNQDGSIAFDELLDNQEAPIYRFKDQVFWSKEALISYFIQRLRLGADDVVIIDRATGLAQEILENCGPARVGAVVHADHFSAPSTDDQHILWNNYYEYVFQHVSDLDFLVTATEAQRKLLLEQFAKYNHQQPRIWAIPVGSLDKLRYPQEPRRPLSIMTASRLASEKHLDWLVRAVIRVHKLLPMMTLDIYGEGGGRSQLEQIIKDNRAGDYVRLMGHQDLTEVYQHYQVYGSASTSEGFGLTLMEAVGSGLALVGFDVRYGNQTFIQNGENGILLPDPTKEDSEAAIASLAQGLAQVIDSPELKEMQASSYRLAEEFLENRVAEKWQALLEGENQDD